MIKSALVSLLLVLASAALGAETRDPATPPLGVATTTTSLTEVLNAARTAAGTHPASPREISEKWTVKTNDLSGTETYLELGDDYRSDSNVGKLHSAEGRVHGKSWHQNYNGYVVVETGVHRRDETNTSALAHALQGNVAGVSVIGEVADPPAYVVKVAPADGRVEYRFYDKNTHLLVRTERAVEGQRVVTVYDDFRTTDGVTRAWHIRRGDGRPYNDEDSRLESLDQTTPIDPARFEIPQDVRAPFSPPGRRVKLPAKIIDDRIIVTAEMGRHRVNFQLDTGASTILLDRSVTDALNIASFGKQTEATAGAYVATKAIVPKMTIGQLVLTDIVVETAPFSFYGDEHTPVAGLLGFDFIAGSVLAIDYEAGSLEAIDSATFAPPEGAIVIPIRLDDEVPIVAARVGGAEGSHFILDTGADRSMLFSDFVGAHPVETTDRGLGEAMLASFPFLSNVSGVGGRMRVRPVQVSSLGVGSLTLPRWLFEVLQNEERSFEGEDFDGLIGQDVLRNFVVYLDYRHAKIYLTPNERYRQRWGS